MSDKIHSTESEVSVLVPQLWSKRYFDVLLAELPFNAIISRDYEGEINDLGDTVKISSIPEFDDAVEISETQRADADAVTATQQSLVINRRIVKDFIVTNKAMMQSIPFVDKLKELAAYSINKKIQSIIIALTVPSASNPDHSIAYDSGTTLALADLLEAKELLDNQDVPMADRHLVMGAAQLNDIFNITGFTSSDFVLNGGVLQTGKLPPELLGFAPHFTSLAGNVSYLFHKSYMTMAAQQGLQVKEYDLGAEGKRAHRINCDTLIGIKQLDNLRVVTIG